MLPNHEGRRVPDVTFRVRENNEWKNVTTHDLFDGKSVAVFSLPGAFTPTCSSTHLPAFQRARPGLLRQRRRLDPVHLGQRPVRDDEWAKDQECSNITVIPDGNGEFTAGMGMLVDKSDLGFGKRSWRYSMLVKDGIVEKMFIEPEEPGDPFKVSDADTLLAYINPGAKKPNQVAISPAKAAAIARRAKALLTKLGYDYAEVPLPHKVRSQVVGAITGDTTVPQVFINGERIGGLEALERWARKAA
jgi:peroxiredoxin/glutaredoxin